MNKKKVDRRRFIKQSSAATLLGISSAAAARSASFDPSHDAEAETQYRGPLTDIDASRRHFDSRDFSLASYDSVKPAMGFSAANQDAARSWQKQARHKLSELVGGFPRTRCALEPVVVDRTEFDGYVREKVIFQTRDNLSVLGYLLLPKRSATAVPAVICLPGHGRGCDDIVGITPTGEQRQTKTGYAKDFAIQVVENGYAAFAIEQLGFGCRRDEPARKKSAEQSSCQPSAGVALLLGQTMAGWRVWDLMRSIDYLQKRREIDPSRIATMGISGGGTISLFGAALDERVKVAVVSGYFNTFRHSIVSLSHCIDNYVPGILNYFEMYDLAGLVAPRALFVESGTRDPIFPLEGSKLAFARAQAIYSVFGAGNSLGQQIFEGEHVFHGEGAFEFLKKRL